MAYFSPALTAFNAGEWTPLLRGRTDTPNYPKSCRALRNMIPIKQGPVRKRPGTKFVNTTKGNAQVRPIPWVFSEDQKFVLEFGAGHIRFWTESGFVETTPGSGVPYEIANSYSLAQVQALQYAQSADVVYLTQEDGRPQVLSRFADNNWTLTDFEPQRGPFLAENGDTTHELRFNGKTGTVQIESDSALFETGHVGAVFALRSVPELLYDEWKAGTAYTAGDYVWSSSLESPGRTNVYKAATTASSGTRAPGHDSGTISDGGVSWQYIHDGYCYVEITSVASSTRAAGTVVYNVEIPDDWIAWQATGSIALTAQPADADTVTFNDGATSVTFEFDNDATTTPGNTAVTIGADVNETFSNFVTAFSAAGFDVSTTTSGTTLSITHDLYGSSYNIAITKSGANISVSGMSGGAGAGVTTGGFRWAEGAWSDYRGWPRCVVIHDSRLWFGYTASEPSTFWGSVIDDFTNFDTGTSLDDEAVIKTLPGLNPIQWMASNDQLMIGTVGGVFVSRIPDSETITPTNIQMAAENGYGCAGYLPVKIGASLMYVQRGRRNIRELIYSDSINRHTATDVSLPGEHLLADGIQHMAWQIEPDTVLWTYDDTGVLIGLTFDREEGILGWHSHDVSGVVEGLCVIPSDDKTQDRLWLVVKRTINGSTARHLEYLSKPSDEVHADSYVSYSGTATTTLAVAHLEGESVAVLADGSTRPEKTVAGGSITLDRSASVIHAGLPMEARLEPQQVDGGSTNGTAQGKPARCHKLTLRLYRTGPGLFLAGANKTLQEIPFRKGRDFMDTAVPLFTGDKGPIEIDTGYDDGQLPVIVHRGPQPCNVIALYPQIYVEDEI